MKQSQTYMIISGMFMAGSFLAVHTITCFIMLALGIYWGVMALFLSRMERKIEILEDLYERKKLDLLISLVMEDFKHDKKQKR